MRIERPTTGYARIVGATGKVSAWVPASDVDEGDRFVHLQGGSKGLAAVTFSWASLSHIEYATEDEMKAMEAAATKKENKP